MIVEHIDPELFVRFLSRTRWFGGKGRPFTVTAVHRVGAEVPGGVEDGPPVLLHLVELGYADAEGGTEVYQVPLALYPEAQTRLEHAFIGWWEEPDLGWVHAYDALHDRVAMKNWLRSFARTADEWTDEASGLTFHRLPGHELDLEAQPSLFAGEQSNSSVLYGEDAVMKLFRKVTAGANPDITVHEALTRAGAEHVAALYGWVEWRNGGQDADEVHHLAMLQQFLRTATDGWDLALASVRNLFAEADLHAHEVGGDFAGEATRLGDALREVHEALTHAFPAAEPADAADLAAGMRARLEDALGVVPELEEHAAGLRAAYDRVAELGEIRVQRIHGDLHLGQTMRTSLGWKIVDFEGEPAKPLAQRQLPDSRWRDVAGMLRSFDYAPHVVERAAVEEDPEGAAQLAYRADEWAQRNKDHFLAAYAGGELTPEQHALLAGYVADKAVYETVYETRNRPTWVRIPLQAIARIGAS
ncbi:maltokinase N-terminal cap-like domain-containing protein [Nocardioides pantholopis]|uniref:maltokinase N-terminal cap-like domain-containing protein n=1 Tax=Nocardioides pantholopis TaxID=2483798 RepID=UPI000F08B566|nr:hypothetical protein [Nocardioides pantholopis]